MGKLLEEFERVEKAWLPERLLTDTHVLRVAGYTASVTRWQEADEWKITVKYFSRGLYRDVEYIHLAGCTADGATKAAIESIRADIGRREWMIEGPARLAALEATVAEMARARQNTAAVTGTVTINPRACKKCSSTSVEALPWVLTSEPPQQPYRCRACNERWTEVFGVLR